MIPYLIAAWLLIAGLFTWALCRAAGLADEALERERERRS